MQASMGGSVAIVLAARHPQLVPLLVLVDANLDPIPPRPGSSDNSGIAPYSEQEFLARGTVPTMRELLLDLKIPRTCLLPEHRSPQRAHQPPGPTPHRQPRTPAAHNRPLRTTTPASALRLNETCASAQRRVVI